jgi:hypothetical protein
MMARVNPRTIFAGALAAAFLFHSQGFCDDAALNEIDKVSDKITGVLFSPSVRKIALTLGLGAGLFQAFMSGSVRPLLVYGGLGLVVCYLPKLINLISSIQV